MTMTMTVLAVLEWRDSIFNVSHVWRDVPRASALTMWMWICGNSWQQCQVQSRWQHIQSYKCIFSKYCMNYKSMLTHEDIVDDHISSALKSHLTLDIGLLNVSIVFMA